MGLYHATCCKSVIFWGLITVLPWFILWYMNDYSFALTPIILCKPSIKILPEILLLRHQVVKYFFLPSNIIVELWKFATPLQKTEIQKILIFPWPWDSFYKAPEKRGTCCKTIPKVSKKGSTGIWGKYEIKICLHENMLHEINILMRTPLFLGRKTP